MAYFICDFQKQQNTSEYIGYGLYFYFSGLSLREAADSRLSDCFIKRNHISIWNWIQKYKPEKLSSEKKKVSEYVIDKTAVIKVGPEYVWILVAIEPRNKEILGMNISKERNMFVMAERFLSLIL
jgi:putative transposase